MSLQAVFKDVAQTLIRAFDDVPKLFYFHSLGTITYDPITETNVESGAIQIVGAVDIFAEAPSKFLSTGTDLSVIPADDTQWFKISGFTLATNNGYAKATLATVTEVRLSGKTVEDTVPGDSVSISGPFYRLRGVFSKFSWMESQTWPLKPNDIRLLVAQKDLPTSPKPSDFILESDIKYDVIEVRKDPADATWTMQIRRV